MERQKRLALPVNPKISSPGFSSNAHSLRRRRPLSCHESAYHDQTRHGLDVPLPIVPRWDDDILEEAQLLVSIVLLLEKS